MKEMRSFERLTNIYENDEYSVSNYECDPSAFAYKGANITPSVDNNFVIKICIKFMLKMEYILLPINFE